MATDREVPKTFLGRLRSSIRLSDRKMRQYRKRRKEALKEYVGAHYSDTGADERVPLNVIQLGVSVTVPNIVAQNPSLFVTTNKPELEPVAYELREAANVVFENIDLETNLARGLTDSMFGWGIYKTGLDLGPDAVIAGERLPAGEQYTERISLDDFAIDPVARVAEEAAWIGHKYRMPIEKAKESGLFSDPDKLEAAYETSGNAANKDTEIAGDDYLRHAELYEYCELTEICLPGEGIVITINQKGDAEDRPQRIVEYDGPGLSPYDLLGFSDVPGSIYPLPPVAIWRDLHDLINILAVKLGRQAERQKRILTYPKSAQGDADVVRKAPDGAVVMVNDPDKLKPLDYGGVHPHNYAYLIWLLGEASKFGGNLDLLAGTGGQADTLGQTQILAGSVSTRLAEMTRRFYRVVESICKKHVWYMLNDPLVKIPIMVRIPSLRVAIPGMFSADNRAGEYPDFKVKVVPYSMRAQTPEAKAQKLVQWFQTFGMTFIQMGMNQGVIPEINDWLRLTAQLMGVEDIEQMAMTRVQPMPQQISGGGRTEQRPLGGPSRPGGGAAPNQQAGVLQLVGATSGMRGGRPESPETPPVEG